MLLIRLDKDKQLVGGGEMEIMGRSGRGLLLRVGGGCGDGTGRRMRLGNTTNIPDIANIYNYFYSLFV